MKVVLTGATGRVGSAVFQKCIANPAITSLVVLARRPLPEADASHSKVHVEVVEDFLQYSDATKEALRGASACIWCLGVPAMRDLDQCRVINYDYTLYGARTLAALRAEDKVSGDKTTIAPIRMVYVSGAFVVRDQTQTLYFMQATRRMRGEVETDLLALQKESPDTLQVLIAKPAIVLATANPLRSWIRFLAPAIWQEPLAQSLVKLAEGGFPSDTVLNDDLIKLGTE